eukprot:3149618-Alexandrium_andersonii.AAC.1
MPRDRQSPGASPAPSLRPGAIQRLLLPSSRQAGERSPLRCVAAARHLGSSLPSPLRPRQQPSMPASRW